MSPRRASHQSTSHVGPTARGRPGIVGGGQAPFLKWWLPLCGRPHPQGVRGGEAPAREWALSRRAGPRAGGAGGRNVIWVRWGRCGRPFPVRGEGLAVGHGPGPRGAGLTFCFPQSLFLRVGRRGEHPCLTPPPPGDPRATAISVHARSLSSGRPYPPLGRRHKGDGTGPPGVRCGTNQPFWNAPPLGRGGGGACTWEAATIKGMAWPANPVASGCQGNPCSTGIRWGVSPAAQMGCLRNRSGSPSGADQL